MRKTIIIFTFLFILKAFGFSLNECYKLFPSEADNLFLNALAVLNSSSKYNVSEIQSKNGYILFTYGSKYYLLTVTRRYQNQSEVKILPQNSEYTQGSEVAKDIFNLIALKLKNPLETVK